MPLFYTGKGDKGESFIGKKKVCKDSPIVEALGDLDELNSLLGVIRSSTKKELHKKLFLVQENLFIIQAEIAWFMMKKFKSPKLESSKVQEIEKEINEIEKKIHLKPEFVISGEDTIASQLDYARAVARRVERSIVKVNNKCKVSKEVLSYCNRLSSYLYALARLEISKKNIKEQKPKYI